MSELATQEALSFDYVNLSEVDPTQKALEEGFYTLKILKAAVQKGIGKTSNKPYECASFTFAVQDHPSASGRRLWERFFANDYHLKAMRRIMDNTGVEQIPGQPLADWLEELSTVQPTFKVKIDLVEDRDRDGNPRSFDFKGDVAKVSKINWWQVQPAA